MTESTEIAIVGAGPAGIAAALAASQAGARVVLIDAMPRAGGRVWANGSGGLSSIDALAATGITHRAGTRVVAATHRELLLEDANDAATLRFERLILATGAREIQLPFPGWTLPGVVAAGGLQLMVKSGLRLDGRRVVVAGSGPLLLAAAASARQAGAQVLCVAEQAPRSRLARFALRLARYPDRALQALQLRMALAHTPYRAGWRVVEARRGDAGAWHVVLVDRAERLHRFDVDLLAVGYSLTPELQLASLLGCRLRDDPAAIETDVFGASSVPGVYAAGEAAGVGGWRKAWVEGRIAGLAAAGRLGDARALLPQAAKPSSSKRRPSTCSFASPSSDAARVLTSTIQKTMSPTLASASSTRNASKPLSTAARNRISLVRRSSSCRPPAAAGARRGCSSAAAWAIARVACAPPRYRFFKAGRCRRTRACPSCRPALRPSPTSLDGY